VEQSIISRETKRFRPVIRQ